MFLETRTQGLHDGYFFVEKGLGVHVQRMLKMSRVCTLAEILSKILVKKTKENWGPYLRSWFDKLTIWCQLNFIIFNYAITACMTYTFTFGKCRLIEKWLTFKNGTFFDFSFYFYYKLCHHRSTKNAYWVHVLLYL